MNQQEGYRKDDRPILKEGRAMRNSDTRIVMRKLSGADGAIPMQYGVAYSSFGEFVIALTPQGVVEVGFIDDRRDEYRSMLDEVRKHRWIVRDDRMAAHCFDIFLGAVPQRRIDVCVAGTPFEIDVWSALLDVPFGETVTYGELARRVGRPGAVRAVAAAVAKNHIAYLIPCHRVIRSDGSPGEYRWGAKRKADILAWEMKCVEEAAVHSGKGFPVRISDFKPEPMFGQVVLQEV